MQLLSSCISSAEELTFRVKRPCFYLSTKFCQQQGKTIILILMATPKVRRGFILLCVFCGPIQGSDSFSSVIKTPSDILPAEALEFWHWIIDTFVDLTLSWVKWSGDTGPIFGSTESNQWRVSGQFLHYNYTPIPLPKAQRFGLVSRLFPQESVRLGMKLWEGNTHKTMLGLGGLW